MTEIPSTPPTFVELMREIQALKSQRLHYFNLAADREVTIVLLEKKVKDLQEKLARA